MLSTTDMDLSTLSTLSQKLNAETDAFTAALTAIQSQLNALNLGVEVWLDTWDLALSVEPVYDQDDARVIHQRTATATRLGYCRLADGWGLAVRDVVETQTFADVPDDWHATSTIEEGTARPLLRASRDVRVAAVEAIPDLIRALEATARDVLTAIEKAKTIADALK